MGLMLAAFLLIMGTDPDGPDEAERRTRRSLDVVGDDAMLIGFLGMAAQDRGDLDSAHRHATRSLELDPTSFVGGHPMAHVYFESGDHVNGLAWLDDWLPGTDQKAMFGGHLVWHAALHHLAIGDGDGALARYPLCGGSAVGGRLIDGPSLLWRCQLLGHTPPGTDPVRPPVSELARGLMDGVPFTFLGMHAALALATAGDADGLRRFADNARGFDAPGSATSLPVLANGLAAFVEGDHAKAADTLLRFEPYAARIGGSHAQREVLEDTVIHALVRAGRLDEAAARLRVRLDRRDSGLDSGLLAETVSGGRANFGAVTAGGSAWTQHAQAVERLRASYSAIPAGQPVRLAKKTSNLFRPRQATGAPGLDVSGLDGVIAVDARGRTADVGGMTTYEHLVDATLPVRTDAPRRPAAAHHHPRRRRLRPRHRVDQLPQRAAARVGRRDGRLHRRRRGGHHSPRRRPLRRVPQLLRLARLRHPAAHRARAGPLPRRPAARPVRRRRPDGEDDRDDHRERRVRRRAGRRHRRRRLRAGGVLPHARPVVRPPGWRSEGQRLHRAADLLPVDPAARDRPAVDLRLPLALGHRLVLVLGRVRRPAPAAAQGLAAQVPPLRRLLPDGRLGPAPPHRRPPRQAGRPAAAREGDPGRRDPGREAAGVPRLVRRRDRHAARLAVPAAAAGAASGRRTRWTTRHDAT